MVGNHGKTLTEGHLGSVSEGRRKEEGMSRRDKIMSKDSRVEKNMSASKNSEKKYRNEF